MPGGSANLTLESGRDVSSDPGGYSMRVRIIAVLAVLSLVALGCSNSDNKADSTTTTGGGSGGGTAVDQPGVTSDTIRVGGVVSKTNALNGPYASAFDGVKAYFNMVNSEGGIYNRKLELVSERDDQMASNQQEVEALLAQDNVFAVDPIATIFLFSGAQKLADENVPTFGWNINTEYTGHPNLFGSNYGALCLGLRRLAAAVRGEAAGEEEDRRPRLQPGHLGGLRGRDPEVVREVPDGGRRLRHQEHQLR